MPTTSTKKTPTPRLLRRFPTQADVGQTVRLREPHTCGDRANELFVVVRVGADVRLRCLACGEVVSFPMARFRAAFHALFFPKRSVRSVRSATELLGGK